MLNGYGAVISLYIMQSDRLKIAPSPKHPHSSPRTTLPVRLPRPTVYAPPTADSSLKAKYYEGSVQGYYIRRVLGEPIFGARQLQTRWQRRQYLQKYHNFAQTCQVISRAVTQRVEKDHLFPAHHKVRDVHLLLDKYQRTHKTQQQRSLYNRYYFGGNVPKISQIASQKPDNSSTLELQTLAKNLDDMLDGHSPPCFKTPEKRMKSQKTRKAHTKTKEEMPEQSYGLKRYGGSGPTTAKKKGRKGMTERQHLTTSKNCITPQPHGSVPICQPRLSERKSTGRKGATSRRSKGGSNSTSLRRL